MNFWSVCYGRLDPWSNTQHSTCCGAFARFAYPTASSGINCGTLGMSAPASPWRNLICNWWSFGRDFCFAAGFYQAFGSSCSGSLGWLSWEQKRCDFLALERCLRPSFWRNHSGCEVDFPLHSLEPFEVVTWLQGLKFVKVCSNQQLPWLLSFKYRSLMVDVAPTMFM